MLFNSISYFLFFALVTAIYFILPGRVRRVFLLVTSYLFYILIGADHAVILLAITLVSYVTGLKVGAAASARARRIVLAGGMCANLAVLFIFKYLAFVSSALQDLLSFTALPWHIPGARIILPVGISFFTFRTISYLVDIYRGKLQPEKHFGTFALYVSFFPSLLAGPIDRAVKLLPQMRREHLFDAERICSGAQIILWGLFKKVVIADRLAMYVDSVYGNVMHHTGLSYIVATYFYTVQIYCDFSGYSDIAIGCARILGYDLMQNFNLPYFATTIGEFWRRWHISLSTWFRDYMYIPLGGNRKGQGRTLVNLLVTMLVCGVWHGAAWTFIVWGGLHGVMLCLSRLTLSYRDAAYRALRVPQAAITILRTVITFNIVAVLWIFFRAEKFSDAVYILQHLFSGWPKLFIDQLSLPYGVIFIAVLFVVELLQTRGPLQPRISSLPLPARWAVYWAVLFSIILFGVDGGSQFIYFQF